MEPVSTPVSNAATTSGSGQEAGEWHFLQCFGERSPGEDIQDGTLRIWTIPQALLSVPELSVIEVQTCPPRLLQIFKICYNDEALL